MVGDARTDEELMRAYVAGDARAFEILYGRYERRIFGFFVRALGHVQRAEDLLQQTFLNLHRARRRYRGGGLAAWIHSIAYNLYRQECRRRARKPEATLEHEPPGAGADPAARLHARHDLERVRIAIDALSKAQREAILLCNLMGLDYRSAAKIASCSADAMKLRAFRGLRALREALDAPVDATSRKQDTPSKRSESA